MPHGSLRRAFPAAELISLRSLRRGDRIQCRARTEPDRDLTVGRVDHVAERSVTLARWIFFFADCLLGTKDQLHTPWTLDFHTHAALLEEAVRKTRSSGISSWPNSTGAPSGKIVLGRQSNTVRRCGLCGPVHRHRAGEESGSGGSVSVTWTGEE